MKSIGDVEENIEEEEEHDTDEAIAALNAPLLGTQGNALVLDERQNIDDFEGEDNEPAKFGSAVLTFQQLQKLQALFVGMKFFINREVPRESLCFAIRSFSGEVSWDKTLFPGATFSEDDETITHQIVDREDVPKKYLNRYYIQPQWVFDCINARALLPVQNYFMGAKLPPHISPFVEERPGDYVPPEKLAMLRLNEDVEMEESEEEEETVKADDDENKETMVKSACPVKQKEKALTKNGNDAEGQTVVRKGQLNKINKARQEENLKNEEKRLKVMMMPKKKKQLYTRIIKSIKHKNRDAEKLKRKREEYDHQTKKAKKV